MFSWQSPMNGVNLRDASQEGPSSSPLCLQMLRSEADLHQLSHNLSHCRNVVYHHVVFNIELPCFTEFS